MDPDAIPPENERQALIQQWIPFAISLAKYHYRDDTRFDYEERVSEALYALCIAAEKFDVSYGTSFGSYAGKVIWDKLRKAAYKRGSLLTRPAAWRKKKIAEPKQQALPAREYYGKDHDGFSQVENRDLVDWIMELLDDQQEAVARGLMREHRQDKIGKNVPKRRNGRGVARQRGVNRRKVAELRSEIQQLVEDAEWDRLVEYVEQLVD